MNYVYSFGAAIVIIGAMMKINHWGPGTEVLALGLTVEAIIFIVAAFDPANDDYEWERVYPELADGSAAPRAVAPKNNLVVQDASITGKLDDMFDKAKLDVSVLERLKDGIMNFSSSVDGINKTVDAASSTQKYSDQLTLAANHMESLNALYQVQLEQGKQQAEVNQKFVEDMRKSSQDSQQFIVEVEKLSKNLSDLNKVYGGMLSAMKSQA